MEPILSSAVNDIRKYYGYSKTEARTVRRVLDQSSASGYFIEVIACNEPYFIQRLSRSVAHVDIRSSPLETIRR